MPGGGLPPALPKARERASAVFVSLQGDLLRHPERRCSPAFCNIEGKQVRSAGNYPLFSSLRVCGCVPAPPARRRPACPPRRRGAERSGAPGRGGGGEAAGPGHCGGPRVQSLAAAAARGGFSCPPPFQLPPGKGFLPASAVNGGDKARGGGGGGGGLGHPLPP